jgi:hypothetical protein
MSGTYNLGDEQISVAVTDEVLTEGVSAAGVAQSFIDGLEFVAAVALLVNFQYGAGGTTCVVVVQTSLDQGSNWIDVARFDFAQASAAKRANLSGLTPVAVGAISVLGSESVLDGIIGDRMRAKITTTGTYSGATSVSVRAVVR